MFEEGKEKIETVVLIIAIIISLLGIAGCIIPALPGPPLNFISLLLLKFIRSESFSWTFLLIWAIILILVTVLDYVLPVLGAKKYNASKQGIWGSVIGMLIGIFFFPPWGMILGLLCGAITGELIAGKQNSQALKVGLATFITSLIMIIVKLIVSGIMTYYLLLESTKILFD